MNIIIKILALCKINKSLTAWATFLLKKKYRNFGKEHIIFICGGSFLSRKTFILKTDGFESVENRLYHTPFHES